MARYQCKACGGIYTDPARDGSRYFHSCAPVHNVAYDAQFTVDVSGNLVPRGTLNPAILEMLERADKRDENVEPLPNGGTRPKNDGKGKDAI